jgi:hypothetical protein
VTEAPSRTFAMMRAAALQRVQQTGNAIDNNEPWPSLPFLLAVFVMLYELLQDCVQAVHCWRLCDVDFVQQTVGVLTLQLRLCVTPCNSAIATWSCKIVLERQTCRLHRPKAHRRRHLLCQCNERACICNETCE